MQHLNDDMDELFRRAAEAYPLNTRGADWEKMHALLPPQEEPPKEKGKNHRQFLWLLLLLPVALICNRITDGVNHSPAASTAKHLSAPAKAEMKQQTVVTQKTETTAINQSEKTTPLLASDKTITPEFSISGKQEKTKAQSGDAVVQRNRGEESFATNDFLIPAKEENNAVAARPSAVITNAIRTYPADHSPNDFPEAANGESVGKDEPALSLVQNNSADESRKQKDPAVPKRRFYAGVVAGPDLSTVRFEKFSEVGFQAGILLGYQISNRFAVEAGALSSKKYYYSEGEYFNTKKVYLPANTKILTVDGDCRMIELPVSLHYKFSEKRKHRWFASAGLSSYLMSKENYTYDYLYLTSGNVVSYQKVYENQTKNWFSVLQLSVGFTSKLGSVGNLRLEPYYTLPLKGIGYGDLPLSSLGFRIGITSKHF